MAHETRCRGCNAKIEFREGPAGRTIPVQRVRTVYLVGRGDGRLARVLTETPGEGGLWVSHFETCPEAGRFSGSRRH